MYTSDLGNKTDVFSAVGCRIKVGIIHTMNYQLYKQNDLRRFHNSDCGISVNPLVVTTCTSHCCNVTEQLHPVCKQLKQIRPTY